jgi:hypothetical protein
MSALKKPPSRSKEGYMWGCCAHTPTYTGPPLAVALFSLDSLIILFSRWVLCDTNYLGTFSDRLNVERDRPFFRTWYSATELAIAFFYTYRLIMRIDIVAVYRLT